MQCRIIDVTTVICIMRQSRKIRTCFQLLVVMILTCVEISWYQRVLAWTRSISTSLTPTLKSLQVTPCLSLWGQHPYPNIHVRWSLFVYPSRFVTVGLIFTPEPSRALKSYVAPYYSVWGQCPNSPSKCALKSLLVTSYCLLWDGVNIPTLIKTCVEVSSCNLILFVVGWGQYPNPYQNVRWSLFILLFIGSMSLPLSTRALKSLIPHCEVNVHTLIYSCVEVLT